MALPAISRMLRVGTLNQIVQDSLAHMPEMNGPDAILHTMGASYETSAADFKAFPKKGPASWWPTILWGDRRLGPDVIGVARAGFENLGQPNSGIDPAVREHLLSWMCWVVGPKQTP